MKNLIITPELRDYMHHIALREHPVLKELRTDASSMALAHMQVIPEQAQFMQFLIRLIGAKNVLEVGTFAGYSALAMALALPDDGQLITCDINKEWTAKAPEFWKKAGQENKIQLVLAPALDTLNRLVNEGKRHSFDFIFIDADKTNYMNYYELALELVSPSGLIAIDNIFWSGKVIDKSENGSQTREIRRLNEHIKNDMRVDLSLLGIADGLFLIKPRS